MQHLHMNQRKSPVVPTPIIKTEHVSTNKAALTEIWCGYFDVMVLKCLCALYGTICSTGNRRRHSALPLKF